MVVGGYLRTAYTRARPGEPARDWLYQLRGDDLLARLIPAVLAQSKVASAEVDDLLIGSALRVSEQWTLWRPDAGLSQSGICRWRRDHRR